jgi:hypothetical protein
MPLRSHHSNPNLQSPRAIRYLCWTITLERSRRIHHRIFSCCCEVSKAFNGGCAQHSRPSRCQVRVRTQQTVAQHECRRCRRVHWIELPLLILGYVSACRCIVDGRRTIRIEGDLSVVGGSECVVYTLNGALKHIPCVWIKRRHGHQRRQQQVKSTLSAYQFEDEA